VTPYRSGERVIVCTEVEAFGGAERLVIALLDWLGACAIPHRLVVYHDHIGMARYAAHDPRVTVLAPSRTPISKIAALRTYCSTLTAGDPKPLMSGFQSALHASAAGLKGFHTLMHDTPSLFGTDARHTLVPPFLRRRASNFVIKRGLRSGGKTIVASDYLKAESERLYHTETVIARPGGLPAASGFHPRVAEGRLRMLSVCRVEANKRIDWLLWALAYLEHDGDALSRRIDWRLDIVGQGSLIAQLRNLAMRLGIGNRVAFHGFVDDTTLEAMYGQAHLFLMPAVQGYGIPAIEALHRGIPVLLHRDSGVSDILLDTPWCVVMEGGQDNVAPALRRSIETVLAGKHLNVMLPHLPTQSDWAEQVVGLCGW
jgi:glycosyltransferase involved in cell wall biosynthesis